MSEAHSVEVYGAGAREGELAGRAAGPGLGAPALQVDFVRSHEVIHLGVLKDLEALDLRISLAQMNPET